MPITEDEIQKVAKLARIQINDQTVPAVTERVTSILGMIDKIQSIDTVDIEPLANPHDAHQRLRPDTVTKTNQRDSLQAGAPEAKDGLFLVPHVMEPS